MTEDDKSFEDLYALAVRLEEAKVEVKRLHSLDVSDVNFVKKSERNFQDRASGPKTVTGPNQMSKTQSEGQTSLKCFRCGKNNHQGNQCRYRNNKCFSCGKVGHLAYMCNSKSKPNLKSDGFRSRPKLKNQYVHQIEDDTNVCSEYDLNTVCNKCS